MLNKALCRSTLLLLTLLFLPVAANAAPTNYLFDSGIVALRATLDDGSNTSVLSGPSPAQILLGGSHVLFDPTASANGTLLELALEPASVIMLDLDETLVTLDTVSIANAMLVNAPGATADLNVFGQFTIATVMSGDVSGVLPGGGTFGPAPSSSLDSGAVGTIGVSGDTITLNMVGVNIARFAQVAGTGPDILIKADFSFTGVVPEPGTALLIGLGLAGLAARGRGRSAAA